MVLLVEGAKETEENVLCDLSPEEHLRAYLQSGMEKNEAIKRVAKERGVHKSEIYKLTL
jgi:16S rRNA (cytidine1402-2'-O)-methyltransferase